jgi:predicted glycosyltransferase
MVHPADVHFFKHVIRTLLGRGDQVLVASRNKDVTLDLLDALDIPHRCISDKGKGAVGLFVELIARDYHLWRLARSFRPDVFVNNNSPCGSHVAWLTGRPSIVFDDTEIQDHHQRLYSPFVTEIHCPRCYRKGLGPKQRRYPGYHSLAYLHPNHFAPDPQVLRRAGIDPDRRKVLLRFVSWGAMHDTGLGHISAEQKRTLVERIGRSAQVLISAEGELDADLTAYRLALPLEDVHHLLANVDLVIGESATMCSEAVVLGTPAVYIDETGRGYTDEQESRYGMCANFHPKDFERVQAHVEQLLMQGDLHGHFAAAHRRMLGETIDVAAYQLAQIDRLAATGAAG